MAVKSSFINMLACLGSVTLVCGALLGEAKVLTEEPISKAEAAKRQQAIAAVSPKFRSLIEKQASDGSVCYIAIGEGNDTVAYVVNASSTGFGGSLNIMVGFRPDTTIYDTAVLSHSETPGLGAKCTEEGFRGQFCGFNPLVSKLSVRKDGGDVDAITASTITSRAFCTALENAVRKVEEIMPSQSSRGESENE